MRFCLFVFQLKYILISNVTNALDQVITRSPATAEIVCIVPIYHIYCDKPDYLGYIFVTNSMGEIMYTEFDAVGPKFCHFV